MRSSWTVFVLTLPEFEKRLKWQKIVALSENESNLEVELKASEVIRPQDHGPIVG